MRTNTTLPIPPPVLNMKCAKAYSGMSEPTLRKYHKAGMLRFVKIKLPGNQKGRTLVDRESLDRLIRGEIEKAVDGGAA